MSSSKVEAMRPRRKVEMQVPAPSPMGVHGESRKIQKPPRSATAKPVIIYMVSPKVIHVEASEFMSLVQRLTGPAGAAAASSSHGDGGGVRRPLPVKVKASRARKGSGGASGGDEQYPPMSSAQAIAGGDISPTLFFHDLSPPTNGVRRDGAMASSPPSCLLHGDYLDPSPRYLSESALVSGSSFMDMLNQLPER